MSTRPLGGRWRACCLAAALALAPASAWAGPRVRVVDVDANANAGVDIICAPSGELLVVYNQQDGQALKVARVTPTATTVSVLSTQRSAGLFPSAAIDSLGLLSVAHAELSGGLYYTLDGGDVFGLNTIPIPGTTGGQHPVMMLDSLDRPFMAYRAAQNVPKLARFDIPSGTWMTETIPGPTMNSAFSRVLAIARNKDDQPAVVYCDQANKLQLATRAPGGWTLRTYSPQSPVTPTGLALDFDTTNAAYVATNVGNGNLSILRFGTLGVSTIYAPNPVVPAILGPHSLRLDDHNGINVAYYDAYTYAIVVATRSALWATTIVDSGVTCSTPALTVDSLNRWAVAYIDAQTAQLRVSAKAWWDYARPDFDCDGHVDGADAQHFLACMTGPGVPQADLNCADADLDGDGDVDLSDFGIYQQCYSGPTQPANPQCAD